MKIALCISGHLRKFDECADNEFFMRLRDKCDVFVSTWDTMEPYSSCNTGIIRNPNLVDIDKVKSVYNTDKIEILKTINFDSNNFTSFDSRNDGRVADYISMHFLINRSVEFAMENGEYDVIIRFRPDIYLLNKVNIHKSLTFPSSSYFPEHGMGCPDIFFMGTPEQMRTIINFYRNVKNYVSRLSHVPAWHERFFTEYIKSVLTYNIDYDLRFQLLRKDPKQFTVGFYGEHDKTHVRIPKI